MFNYLKGKLAFVTSGMCVVETGGIGWQLFISDKTSANLSKNQNSDVTVFTYLNVREDALELFGFFTVEELEMFKMLIQVSGIGPKVALAVLSSFDPKFLSGLISCGDAKTISQAQGIGLKTAQKLILELKDKISKNPGFVALDFKANGNSNSGGDINEAVNALVVLGYPLSVATENVNAVKDEGKNLQDIIRLALKRIGKNKEN